MANIDVTYHYDNDELSDLLKVCRLHRAVEKNGVGIFVRLNLIKFNNFVADLILCRAPNGHTVTQRTTTHMSMSW